MEQLPPDYDPEAQTGDHAALDRSGSDDRQPGQPYADLSTSESPAPTPEADEARPGEESSAPAAEIPGPPLSAHTRSPEIGEEESEEDRADDTEMDFLEHLEILRWHVIRSFIYVMVGMASSFWWVKYVIHAMTGVLQRILEEASAELGASLDQGPIFTSFQEVVSVWIKAALIAGLIAALPFVFIEVWRFVEPALTKREKRMARPIVLGAPILFVLGAGFAWMVLPFMIKFLFKLGMSMIGTSGRILPRVGEFLNLVLAIMLAMGIVFQLPLVIGILARLGVVSSRFLATQRRYAYVLLAVVVAVLTPTVDIVNWSIAMGPMVVLYEVSIFVARFVEPKETAAS